MQRLIKFSPKGFSLLDVIFAVGVIIIGLISILSLFYYVLVIGRLSENRFIASNLAQEGIEIVRAIRDSNWKAIDGGATGRQWNEGFTNLNPQDYRVQYNTPMPAVGDSLITTADYLLNLDANGFYSHDSGTATQFSRKVTISNNVTDGYVNVISEVSWSEPRYGAYKIIIEDRLYNWW